MFYNTIEICDQILLVINVNLNTCVAVCILKISTLFSLNPLCTFVCKRHNAIANSILSYFYTSSK